MSNSPSFLKNLALSKGLLRETVFFCSDSIKMLFFSSQILLTEIVSSIS